jgi:hypothetical protein
VVFQELIAPTYTIISLFRAKVHYCQSIRSGQQTEELEQLKPESAESFVRKLRTVWHHGEVRPTHRRQAARHWRTRSDPFETAKPRIHEQLSLTPEMGARNCSSDSRKNIPVSSPRIKFALYGEESSSGEWTGPSALSSRHNHA